MLTKWYNPWKIRTELTSGENLSLLQKRILKFKEIHWKKIESPEKYHEWMIRKLNKLIYRVPYRYFQQHWLNITFTDNMQQICQYGCINVQVAIIQSARKIQLLWHQNLILAIWFHRRTEVITECIGLTNKNFLFFYVKWQWELTIYWWTTKYATGNTRTRINTQLGIHIHTDIPIITLVTT